MLSPDMCVERKAIPDLRQSLASGRLFHQVVPQILLCHCNLEYILMHSCTLSRSVTACDRPLMGSLAVVPMLNSAVDT